MVVNNSLKLIIVEWNKDIVWQKEQLLMCVSRHLQDLTWIRRETSSHIVSLAFVLLIQWWSKHWCCFVQVNQLYQPGHKRCSFAPCCPYLATYNISPNNTVNTRHIGQCLEKKPFTNSCRQMCQINKGFHIMTSSSKWSPYQLRSRNGMSLRRIEQHMIYKAA
jgi:hypothetical protein